MRAVMFGKMRLRRKFTLYNSDNGRLKIAKARVKLRRIVKRGHRGALCDVMECRET